MQMLLKGGLALFWLLVIPLGMGACIIKKEKIQNPAECLMLGYPVMFGLLEVIIFPFIYKKAPLHVLVIVYGLLLGICSFGGIVKLIKTRSRFHPAALKKNLSLWFVLAVLLIFAQVLLCVFLAHMDADDSFFVALATTDAETDTIFEVMPYTGDLYSVLPSRYVLSPFPVFLAVISRLSGGLHPAVLAHMVFPLVFLPVSYLVQYKIAGKWYKEDGRAKGIYLFFCAVLSSFSAYSVYNAENFKMIRIWQGKALLAAFLLPVLFYLCLSFYMEEKMEYWLFLAVTDLGCCLSSSMGIILAPLMMVGFAAVDILYTKKIKKAVMALAASVPSAVLALVYLLALT